MNTHIKEAGFGKRLLSYFLDAGMVLVCTGLLYGLVIRNTMLPSILEQEGLQDAFHFAAASSLEAPYGGDGEEITSLTDDDLVYSVGLYSFDDDVSSTQTSYGYELYFNKVWYYYTQFIPTNENAVKMVNSVTDAGVTTTTDFTQDDYYTYVEVTLMGLPTNPTAITDVSEANIKGTNSYFKYALNTAGTAVDITKMPVLQSAIQTSLDSYTAYSASSEDVSLTDDEVTAATDYLSSLASYFYAYDSSTYEYSGLYYDAVLNMKGEDDSGLQTYFSSNYDDDYYNIGLWSCYFVSFIPFQLLFLLIIPLVMKNGETLGKKICKLAVVTDQGYQLDVRGRILHPLCVTVLGGLISTPWLYLGFMGYILLALIDYMVLVMSKTHQSLHDKLAHTLVISSKESLWWKNDEEMRKYASEHPESFPELKNEVSDAEGTRIAQEDSILDLSTMNKNRDEATNMSKFDEFEKNRDATQAEGAALSAPKKKVNLTKIEEDDGDVTVPPEVQERAMKDLAAIEGVAAVPTAAADAESNETAASAKKEEAVVDDAVIGKDDDDETVPLEEREQAMKDLGVLDKKKASSLKAKKAKTPKKAEKAPSSKKAASKTKQKK
jgi:uncharacterized RDD family membrane protein YckC